MTQLATYSLSLPCSLKDAVSAVATQEGISMDQFITTAMAEKLAALNTEQFFSERGQLGDKTLLRELLTRDGGESPRRGDELLD